MVDIRTAPYGALALRLALGGLFLAHAGLKLFTFKPAGTAAFFDSVGVPGALAYVVIAAEVLGGLALILGVWPRAAALALAPILIGAVATVHGPAGFFFTAPNGGWEFPAFWLLALVVQALIGDGAFALRATPTERMTRRPAFVAAE